MAPHAALQSARSDSATARHIGNPPGSCLSGLFRIGAGGDARKARQRHFSGAAGGRFWHGFAVRTAAGMAAPERAEGRRCTGRDFGFGRCIWRSPWTTRVQRNVRTSDRSQWTPSLAGGGRSHLRAFAAGRVSGYRAGRAAGGAALQSPPRAARRAGAVDRGADGRAGGFRVREAAAVCRYCTAGKPAGIARRGGWSGGDRP